MADQVDHPLTSQVATSLSLIVRVREGDPSGWKRFVTLYSPMIYAWCRGSGLQPADAEDVAQETFSSVANSIGRFSHNGSPGSLRAWLWTITRNKILDHLRNHERRPAALGGTDFRMILENQAQAFEEVAPESPADEKTMFLRALELLRLEFSDQTWQAFWRLTVERTSAAKIGEELGMTKKAVRQAKYRVIQRLRAEFGEILELEKFLSEDQES